MMFKHILLPTDGSPLSEKGVKRGIAFAKGTKARVTTMHVVPQFRILADDGILPSSAAAQLRQRLVAEATDRAKKIVDRPSKWAKAAGVRCKSVIVPPGGLIYEKIIATARKEKCDLIFMSSHGRRGIASVLLGSETSKVLAHSKVPVLVVR
jgi:nucleotide-binding universal stress UspA family protein